MLRTVLFVLPSLDWGGAQRTILNIVNHLDRERYKPVLALFRNEGPYVTLLKDDICIEELKCSRARFSILSLSQLIRAVRPHLILSTIRYINVATLMSAILARTGTPVLVRETNHQTAAGVGTRSWREQLVAWSYRRAQKVVSLSNGVREDVIRRYRLRPEQVVTIYNPVDLDNIAELALKPVNDSTFQQEIDRNMYFQIIGVGALERQKGYDLLIEALAGLDHVPYKVRILGEGSERERLSRLMKDHGMEDRVLFMGYQRNPYAWMARADLCVFPSRWEGFGHVIAEAMACGAPVLAARCQAGPDEIISNDVDGRLCEPESVSSLAYHIDELWREPAKRKRYATMARESVRRFDVKVIVKNYERLFSEVAVG